MSRTYHIITIGCQMNKADSERLVSYLEANNFIYNPQPKQSDLIVLNTCGVRQSAEDRIYGLVNEIRGNNKVGKIVISGCLAKRPDVQRRLENKVDLFLPINQMSQLLSLLENKNQSLEPRGEEYFKIKPSYKSNFSAFVPIGNGCNNFCSYCVVPYARGPEVYRAAPDIINEVKELIEKGYKEIILIAQNVNSYQSDDYNFAKLLQEIAAWPGEFWIQFFSSHPKDMTAELIKVIGSSNKICNHVHLAVQSGDNKILKAMNRHYRIDHYYDLIKQIRKLKPGVSITTDVIVGFPGESRWQFHQTAKLFRRIKYDMAYIAQYSPRPGTAAAKLADNVSAREKRRREKKLENILRKTALKHNQKQVGQEDIVLVEGKNKRQEWYGKDSGYRTVKFIDNRASKTNLTGTFAKLKITKAYSFGIIGEIK